jgi:bifunctional non-homologous end joining protein LigD
MTSRSRTAPDQLVLALDGQLAAPLLDVRAPARPAAMLPGEGPAPFDDDGWFFEPWWPGILATMVIDDGRVELLANQLADPLPAFPELRSVSGQLHARLAVIPGTLLVLDTEGRPDQAALRRRLADPDDRGGVGAFIAADLLSRDGRPLAETGFAARRSALLETVVDGDRFLSSRGLHGEGRTLADAAASMGIQGISARRLDAPWRSGVAAEAWLRLPVVGRSVGPVRPLLLLLQRLPLG